MFKTLIARIPRLSNAVYTCERNFARQSAISVMSSKTVSSQQKYDYFLVLDFEATCENNTTIDPQEIIEFPVLKINGSTFQTESEFHQYVRPVFNPQITQFCTELTGITQDDVDEQPDFKETLQLFDDWMKKEGLLNEKVSSICVTCGDWDLQTMLKKQCKTSNIEIPSYFKEWINIKKPFCDVMGLFPKGMMQMLTMLELKHFGRHHSGIDDCRNIANILKQLAQKGFIYNATSF